MNKYIRMVVCLFFLGLSTLSLAAPLPPYIDNDFILFWEAPVRAYPGIPLDFRFVAYEKDNQKLAWQLFNAPAGMIIDASGKIIWTPAESDSGSHNIVARVTRQSGDFLEKAFSLSVDKNDFLFVSTSGNDSNSGTITSPFRTIEKAMRSIGDGNGKTILIRGGIYREHYNWETGGVYSPFRGKNFSSSDPVEIRSYPGEWAVLDIELQGHGLWAFGTSYVIFSNIEVTNASAYERGGIMVGESNHIVIKDTIVHDSHWPASANCTGYLIGGVSDTILDHTEGYANWDTDNYHWNSSNYLVYTEAPSSGSLYILNSQSHDSISGFKIKHAGPAKLVLHNNRSVNDMHSFAVASDNSSVRYCVSQNAANGVVGGIADPNAYTVGKILIEHNTIVDASGNGILISDGYLTGGSEIRNNIIYNNMGAAGTGENDNRLMGFWYYDDNADTHALFSDRNIFYSPSQNNIVRYGHLNYNYSYSSWKNKGYDINSFFDDPEFRDFAGGDLTPKEYSPACGAASDGGDLGALACPSTDTQKPNTPKGLSVN